MFLTNILLNSCYILLLSTVHCIKKAAPLFKKTKKKSLFPKQGVRIHSFFFSGTTTYQINLRVLFTHMYGSADMKSNCLL